MRVHVALAALIVLTLTGCFKARQAEPPSRATPAGTVEMFKAYARQRNREGEWDILSPAFKERLSQRAGRNVDLADWVQARDMYSTDPRVAQAERFLQNAVVVNTVPDGPNAVKATIQVSGGPFISKSGIIRMVKLDRWELYVRGQTEPYTGTNNDPLFGVEPQADGSYVIWYRDTPGGARSEEVIPAADVANFVRDGRWYVDHLGDLEGQFM